MRKRLAGLLLAIILVSSLSTAFVVRPISAQNIENEISEKGFCGKTIEADLTSQRKSLQGSQQNLFEANHDAEESKILESSPQPPENIEGEWDFNDTRRWSDYAYMDGNKTRLIIGIDGQKPASLVELEKIVVKHQAKIVNTVSIKGQVRAAVVELSLESVTAFFGELHIAGLASYVEPNMRVQAQFVPNDPYWSMQWGPQKIEADWAWNSTVGSHDVLVAVVDTGIYYTHDDLAANYAPLGYDWVNMDPDPIDDHGHGTHCAGIIAAVLNNGIGIAGLAQVRVMAEKVLDSGGYGLWDWVANGIIHAVDEGAKIISMSIGGYGDSELVHEAVKYAYDSGVLVVAAAGNDNTNMKLYPAGYDEVVAVAATDEYDYKAWFSNWGNWIELAAPGVNIYSTVPWGYESWSGTSMATPHVSGLAALVWSKYPNKTRDWVRLWLRYTADDLGDPGFDVYYGYGRINARKAVEQAPPAHELIAYEWRTPPYVEPGASEFINATILNFGENSEANVAVQLLANETMVDSAVIGFLAGGNSATVSLLWNPPVEGSYNVTLYVVPVPGETSLENNVVWKYIFVGFPVKAVVLHSAGNVYGEIITNWQVLSSEWYLFGDTMVYIDYTTLNKENIDYEDIAVTEADVLIISCASDPYAGWQFTDSEIEAITRYVHEGHGLIATAGTLYYGVPNNNKLAPLFGLNETIMWTATWTDLLHLLNITHPIFTHVPNPLVFPQVQTALPYDGRWDSNELVGGKYLALGHYQESAIVTFKGLVYISPWLEIIPPYYHHPLQLLYNAIIWSRYQKPQHELVVSLETPKFLQPGESTLLNATVSNMGLNNETNIELYLLIDSAIVNSTVIPDLPVGTSHRIDYLWSPSVEKIYNITAYSPPLPGEDFTFNNLDSVLLYVRFVRFVLWDDTKDADGDSLTGNYLFLYQLLTTSGFIVDELAIGSINSGLLASYDILVLIDPEIDFYPSEIADIQNWVAAGGALISIPDGGYPPTINTVMAPYGVQMTGRYGGYGTTTDIISHPITQGVGSIYVDWVREISVTTPSTCLAWVSEFGERYAFLSASEGGEVVVVSDSNIMDNNGLGMADNTQLMLNIFNWVGIKPEHDLAVTLEASPFVEPNTSVLLNATVRNRGLNNETAVELFLLINGTVVNNVTIPELLTGASHTINYSWNPKIGVYNITAYAPPMPGENVSANNVVTKMVLVRYLPKLLVVDTPVPEDTGALDLLGYKYTWVTPTEFAMVDLYQYNVLFIGWIPGDTLVDALLSRASEIADWVAAGNGIVALAEFSEVNRWAWLPLFASSSGFSADAVHILNPTHPVMSELTDAGLSGWGNSYHGYFYSFDPSWETLAEGVEAAQPITLVTTYGAGRIAITNQDPDYHFYYGHIKGAEKLLRNMIEWATPYIRYEHDLAVSLAVPTFLELDNSAWLNATVVNRGMSNETDVHLYLAINGSIVSSAIIPELLLGESYTINYEWTATATGGYNVTAYALPVPEEECFVNNIVTKWPHVFFYMRSYLSPEWIGDGIPMGWHADDKSWNYTLPFDFPFYGIYYRTIYISSNGLITFRRPDSQYYNSIPELAKKFAIAPAWEDWVTDEPYDIYIWQNSSHVFIRWYVAAFYNRNITANFEAVLREDGVIQFNYGHNNGTVFATVGISNGANHILAEDLAYLNYVNTRVFDIYRHDVAIQDVSIYPTQVYVGQTVDINVTAVNEGDVPESFNVMLYYSSENSSVPSEPHPANAMWIEPSTLCLSPETPIGCRFNVTVWANSSRETKGWQFWLLYASAYINARRAGYTAGSKSEFFQNITTLPVSPSFWMFNGTHNRLDYGEAWLFGPYRSPGYGSLCWIEFEVVAMPGIAVDIPLDIKWAHEQFENPQTYLLYSDGSKKPLDIYNGLIKFTTIVPPVTLIGVQEVIDLPAHSCIILNFKWNTTGLPLGTYVITASAGTVRGEINVLNNMYTDGTVEILWIHDVSVVNVNCSRTWVYQGGTPTINVTVKNKGDYAETVTVFLYYNMTASSIIGIQTVDLQPKENTTITFIWNTTNVQYCHNYTITAVATIIPEDSNSADNILADGGIKVRILGDINDDGYVGIDDITCVAEHFGETPDRTRWNPEVDLNLDNYIGIDDIVMTASNFGYC